MKLSDLDNPIVLSTLFYPRAAAAGHSRVPGAQDGTIPVAEDVVLGYRLYPHTAEAPVILYFHGNGEIASDHDFFAHKYHEAGASLLVVDYRGYGWSTGKPTTTALLGDIEPVIAAMPTLLESAGLQNKTLLVMGRSLGSAPAIHAAYTHQEMFKGIIIESGFGRAMNLLSRLGLPPAITEKMDDPVGNDRKLAELTTPLLIIHGSRDNLLPITHGERLYDASIATHKEFLKIIGAGHNDLLFLGEQQYFEAITRFINATTTSDDSA